MTTTIAPTAYEYLAPSTASTTADGSDVRLATSAGTCGRRDEAALFFGGHLLHPAQMAQALLLVAKVAGTRFYVPPAMRAAQLRAADPVVTSNGDRLRFESFSACGGVYARLDVLSEGMAELPLTTGTTNVDVNEPLQMALATVGTAGTLHLSVGRDVVVRTGRQTIVEKKVPLPARWLRGFAEVQIAGAGLRPALEVPAAEARRFLRQLPPASSTSRSALWSTPVGRGLRVSSRPGPGGVPLGDGHRLRVLEPMLRFAESFTAYAPGQPGDAGVTAWVLELRGARITVTVSPTASRGFSGEGGVLFALADPRAAADADLISVLLAYEPRIDVARLAREAALPEDRVLAALTRLGAAGRVGFDVADNAYFHRELPFDASALLQMHPRLRDAHRLVDEGKARSEGSVITVDSGDAAHLVRSTASGPTCTCPWYGEHRLSRGPCKHILAAKMVTGRGRVVPATASGATS